jgi:2OG-Fe(II) oxygenase superfamily
MNNVASTTVPMPVDVLANRRWLRRRWPFPHVVADQVFASPHLEAFTGEVLEHVDAGAIAPLARHDLSGATLTSSADGPLRFFVSRPWHDLLAKLFGVASNLCVNCGIHHHHIGSSDGFPHHDLNPGWFIPDAQPDGIILPQPLRCSYTTGEALDPTASPVESARAVAVLIYLANGAWHPGDGGETGLYLSDSRPADPPTARIAPIDNRLLAFECTPTSMHGFLSNRAHPRNSIIMWLHQSVEAAAARWGEGAVTAYAP